MAKDGNNDYGLKIYNLSTTDATQRQLCGKNTTQLASNNIQINATKKIFMECWCECPCAYRLAMFPKEMHENHHKHSQNQQHHVTC